MFLTETGLNPSSLSWNDRKLGDEERASSAASLRVKGSAFTSDDDFGTGYSSLATEPFPD